LKRDKIINRQDVEKAAACVKMPAARERQILNFHAKYGATSALYGSLRAQYPNY
jgi:hypothetical protein